MSLALALLAATAAPGLAGELDAPALVRALAAERGRPVVVQFWASWCGPCLEEFPGLVALARRRGDVRFLSVAVDDAEDREAVLTVLRRERPPFPVYLKAGKDQPFIDGVDPEWSGVVPATLVLDASGRKLALLQGEHSTEEIERALGAERSP